MADTRVMPMSDFLLARIAEDEWVAGTASEVISGPAQLGRHLWTWGDGRLEVTRARVLAECQAKREIVAELSPCVDYDRDKFIVQPSVERLARATLQHLAAVYADHPDYREEWKP
jgi:hypothetical protein